MSFYYLLLGHLLGDFTFQTDRIAANKNKHWKWNLLHTIIVTLSMLIFALSFGSFMIFLVIINGITHYIIDYFKAKIPLNTPVLEFIYFIVDQSLHISIIYLMSLAVDAREITPTPLFNENLINLFIILVFVISFSSIFVQYILKIFFPKTNRKFFENNERTIGNITRIFIFFLFYLSYYFSTLFLILVPVFILTFTFYFYNKWNSWMGLKYFHTKLILDFFMSIIGFVLLLS